MQTEFFWWNQESTSNRLQMNYRMTLKIIVGRSKVLVVGKDQRTFGGEVQVDRKEMEEMDKFKSLGIMVSTNVGMRNK